MKYETARFGTLDLGNEDVIRFPVGLYGFEPEKEFTFLPFAPNVDSPLEWMQSLHTPGLAFVITDPALYVPEYTVKLTEDEKKGVGFKPGHTLQTRVIVTVPKNYLDMTANLVAPLVINLETQTARQFVLTSVEYDTRHHLLPREVREAQVSVTK